MLALGYITVLHVQDIHRRLRVCARGSAQRATTEEVSEVRPSRGARPITRVQEVRRQRGGNGRAIGTGFSGGRGIGLVAGDKF